MIKIFNPIEISLFSKNKAMSKVNDNKKNIILNKKQKEESKNKEVQIDQVKSKQRSSLPQINFVTQRLQNKIQSFKSQHTALARTLEEAIASNNFYLSLSASELEKQKNTQLLDRRHIKRQNSLVQLQNSIQRKIKLDKQAQYRLMKIQQEIKLKKQAVAKQLAEVQFRNLNKIMQIEQMEKNFLAKMQQQIRKNLEKEKRLKKDFQRISKQSGNLAKVKQLESKIDNEAWKQILDRKLNLERRIQKNIRKKDKLIEQKNQMQEKAIFSKGDQKKILKPRIKLDAKEAGRQYLQFAKRKGSVGNKLKKNYMNINLKVINYENEVLDRIGNNDGSLSKNYYDKKEIKQKMQNSKVEKQSLGRKVFSKVKQPQIIPILQQSRQQSENSQFSDMDEIFQVKKIKKGIQQIEAYKK